MMGALATRLTLNDQHTVAIKSKELVEVKAFVEAHPEKLNEVRAFPVVSLSL